MLQTYEVQIDQSGKVQPLESSQKLPAGRGLLTLLTPDVPETALLAEAALAEDWSKEEEDQAWEHLQPGK